MANNGNYALSSSHRAVDSEFNINLPALKTKVLDDAMAKNVTKAALQHLEANGALVPEHRVDRSKRLLIASNIVCGVPLENAKEALEKDTTGGVC